jgi:hypothetical protein
VQRKLQQDNFLIRINKVPVLIFYCFISHFNNIFSQSIAPPPPGVLVTSDLTIKIVCIFLISLKRFYAPPTSFALIWLAIYLATRKIGLKFIEKEWKCKSNIFLFVIRFINQLHTNKNKDKLFKWKQLLNIYYAVSSGGHVTDFQFLEGNRFDSVQWLLACVRVRRPLGQQYGPK